MAINFKEITESLIGCSVDRPNAKNKGTLSGHAAGDPFSVLLYNKLKQSYPDNVFKQHEYLNNLFLCNPNTKTDRSSLVQSPTARFLLTDQKESTIEKWTPEKPLAERQNDTADMLYSKNSYINIIDAKTTRADKKAQAPNIISAYKVARMCSIMLSESDFDSVDIHYVNMKWVEDGDSLKCINSCYRSLFKIPPSELYINWAAAMQIQIHVEEMNQGFTGTKEEWAKQYLQYFTESAAKRISYMKENFITPFQKHL